jgi:AAA+ ATPase superfamily predicted ATPase
MTQADTKDSRVDDKYKFINPFRPGAGHMPPHLAGREGEIKEFRELLKQDPILRNLILTGLRGVGKTVLLDTLRPVAIQEQWGWVGTDLSESASITEDRIAIRILTDLSVYTSDLTIAAKTRQIAGFHREDQPAREALTHQVILRIFNETPGLIADKLKHVLELVWGAMQSHDQRGIVFAYDEAQNMADHAEKNEFPLSLLLDVFQSVQRKGMRFILVLTGLPTLFSKLVEARTYSERMFHVVFLDHLEAAASREAILVPIREAKCPFQPTDQAVGAIIKITGGYPYFIQFVCKEVYDIWLRVGNRSIPIAELLAKLDVDFFSARWAKATDRQRDLLRIVAQLPTCDAEFTGLEIVACSKQFLRKPFSSSHVNQMLGSLQDSGLVYKNRHGKYSFAVPLLGQFIKRQTEQDLTT